MMKKKILSLMVIVLLLSGMFILTGCDSDNSAGSASEQESKGNYDVFESIKKIEPDATFEEINELMGFDGEVKSESDANSTISWKLYTWKLTDNTSIEVRIFDETNSDSISAYYPNDMIKNKKVDFSKSSEMKKKMNSKEGLKYDEVVEMLGGVEGTLDKKDSTTDTYVWVNADGGSLTVRFSRSNGKCTSFNGVF